MASKSQRKATRTHRRRAAVRGLVRVEVQAPRKDAALIRALAETLRAKTEEAEALRLALTKAVMPTELKTAFDVFGSELPDDAFAGVFDQPRQRDWAWYRAGVADGPRTKETVNGQATCSHASGEVLREEFLLPLGLSPGALAKACSVPRTRIERLSNEETGVTADTALRLSKAFGTSPELWLNLQTDYDIQIAKRQIGKDLAKIEPIDTKAA